MNKKSSNGTVTSHTSTGSSTTTFTSSVNLCENHIEKNKVRKGLQELANQRSAQDYEHNKYKLGRILTVIDAAITDPEQRKATKDLVNTIWYEQSGLNYPGISSLEMHLADYLGFELWDKLKGNNVAPISSVPFNPIKQALK